MKSGIGCKVGVFGILGSIVGLSDLGGDRFRGFCFALSLGNRGTCTFSRGVDFLFDIGLSLRASSSRTGTAGRAGADFEKDLLGHGDTSCGFVACTGQRTSKFRCDVFFWAVLVGFGWVLAEPSDAVGSSTQASLTSLQSSFDKFGMSGRSFDRCEGVKVVVVRELQRMLV